MITKMLTQQTGLMACALAALLLIAPGCERPDWESAEYVAAQLTEGDDRQKREALGVVRNFEDDAEARPILAAALSEVYLGSPSLRDDVMRHLIQWREAAAAPAYVEEMKENHTGAAEHAAENLGIVESRDSIPAMVEAFAATGNDERRDGILRGLKRMPDPSVVEVGLEVLALDPDNHRISMHSHTCDMFGELALAHPDAITDEVIAAVIRAVFLSDEVGRMIAGECRLALQKIGPKAIPHMVELFNQENEAVERLLMTYEQSTDNFQFPFNRAKQEAVVMLTVMRAPEAVELFIEDFAEEKSPPENYTGQRRLSWIRMEGASISEMLFGLGDLGDPAARPVLEAALRGEQVNGPWSDITDDMVDFEFRQNAARALAHLGDREARPALMRAARADVIPTMERRFRAMAQQAGEELPETERYRPQWQAARAFAMLATADDREAFQELVDAQEEGGLKERLESFLAAFDVMDECSQDDAEAKAQCLAQFLTHDAEAARFKAGYELGHLPAEAAGPVIAENLSTRDLEIREVLAFSAYRSATPAIAEAAGEQWRADESRSASEYRLDRIRLQMLEAYLKRDGGEAAVAEE